MGMNLYAVLSRDRRDIMPRIASAYDPETGYTQDWIVKNSDEIWGRSQGGDGVGRNKRWWLKN